MCSACVVEAASSAQHLHDDEGAVYRKYFQPYITPWRAVVCPLERADAVSLTTDSMGAIVMYNYPVFECLVAFAIVFSIGFLFAKCNRSDDAMASPNGVAHT